MNSEKNPLKNKFLLTFKEVPFFAIIGAMMFVSKLAMEGIPNVHLNGLFICACAITFGSKAIFPLYVYVFLDGIRNGFGVFWIPYLYIWLVLFIMALITNAVCEKFKTPKLLKIVIFDIVSAIHGLSFGLLWSPYQKHIFHMSNKGIKAWWISGLPFDVTHCVGNAVFGMFILPLAALMIRLNNKYMRASN